MVQTTDQQLIISLPTMCGADDLHSMQREIIAVMQHYNYKDFGNIDNPFLNLLCLLEATLPTYRQLRHVFEFSEWANNPAPDKIEFEKWIRQQMEAIRTDNE